MPSKAMAASCRLIPHMLRSVFAILLFWLAALRGTRMGGGAAAEGEGLAPGRSGPPAVEEALSRSGGNRAELEKALREAPEAERPGLAFLLENMPRSDLTTLSAAFLLENTALAYQAWREAPWAGAISSELFLNEVLPYASVSERRDAWRKPLHDLCLPLVKDLRTPGEAARRLNEKLFGLVKVRYSTERKRADQGPLESMESGVASCTGLSILLLDGCRSVGVPARLVGTPNWSDGRGNHTWVEVWDGGWHFTGAAEPSGEGLDHAWFQRDASLARKDSPEHAIYAPSFKRTSLPFPMVWGRGEDPPSALNVTDRYAPPRAEPTGMTRLLIKVLARPGGPRIALPVRMTDSADSGFRLEGTSRDERSDSNDLLAFDLPKERTFQIGVEAGGKSIRRDYRSSKDHDLIELCLEGPASPPLPGGPASAGSSTSAGPAGERLERALGEFFAASSEKQAEWKFEPEIDALLLTDEQAARTAAWEAYRKAPVHEPLREDYRSRRVRSGDLQSPYTVREVGKKPEKGWPLFIAMHGGGGAPKEVNDSQWQVMQRYYRDQDSVPGYLYLALRAPNDAWNGFYFDLIYPLVENLIRQFLLFGEVDPDRVFIMGYSHGGYGAFAIGPKMPDRFAAIHSSAAAPTDGETSPRALRTTLFTYMIGENDHAYGRLERCRKFDEAVRKLRGDRTDIYPVTMEYRPGFGHGGLPDRDKIKELYPAVRNPAPREVSWEMTDTVIKSLFWLQVKEPAKGQALEAALKGNRLVVSSTRVAGAAVYLDGRLVDLRSPLTLVVNGSKTEVKLEPRLSTLCRTLLERGDPQLAFTVRIDLKP
jgi:predicted esterase